MKKLRLLVTEKCNRSCIGCCNKGYDLSNLPVCNDFTGWDEILLTGGEPMLKPLRLLGLILNIRGVNPSANIILYTAKVDALDHALEVFKQLDGITVTLHEQKDEQAFIKFSDAIDDINFGDRSLHVNIFKDVKIHPRDYAMYAFAGWKIKSDIEWIKDCPLPKNETFMRLSN